MIKKIFLLIVMALLLFANEIEVKDSNVTLLIDGKKEIFNTGKYVLKKDIKEICFEDGKGKVIFNNIFKLDKNSEIYCYQLAGNKGFRWSNIYAYFKDTGYDGGNAVSRKSITKKDKELKITKLIIPRNEKYIHIKMKDLEPLPIRLLIFDNQHELVKEFTNVDNEITLFEVKTSFLKDGYILELHNALEEIVIRGIVTFQ